MAQALAQLRPLVDGVVLECAGHRSTFLPQVWEQLPTVDEFMRHLKRKAGLPENFWSQEVRLQRYTVEKWKEEGLPA
jgi:AMMECR1 domain-containing protein